MADLQPNTNAVVRGGWGAEAEIDTEVAAGHPDGRSAANGGSLPSGASAHLPTCHSGLDGVMK